MLQLLLFLHVLGAIVVFGPTFAFPLIASQARKSPQNGHFAVADGHEVSGDLDLLGDRHRD